MTVFASQMANQNLNFIDYIFALIVSIIASVGGAGVNNAGLITYVWNCHFFKLQLKNSFRKTYSQNKQVLKFN